MFTSNVLNNKCFRAMKRAKFPHSPIHHYTSIYGALFFSVSPVRCTCIIKYGAVRKFFHETCEALKECYLMCNIPKRNLASGCHLLKKIDQPSWRTTRRNYKHIPQIVCISSRFRVLHLLSWEFERSEVLWRYTVILICHLKHAEVGWSTRKYPHTDHLS